ncbi:hypothetical protein [Haladaptatus caseinilyticus]|uniref:hypothetical protein n=1 Tax=Haladaptatus caseinilyticus TaxID=2993314 RepID=UPI00224B6AFA|nr:hypothetical protein [Haladaptatus caseinilyticus]
MSDTNTGVALMPERPLLVGVVLVTALVTGWVFVPTMQGHIATMNTGSVDVTATEYTVTGGGEHLTVALRIHNPTRRAIVLSSGQIHAYDGQTRLTDGTTTSLDETTVPAGETLDLTIDMDLSSEHTSQANQAAKSGSVRVTGMVRGAIGDEGFSIPVRIGGAG